MPLWRTHSTRDSTCWTEHVHSKHWNQFKTGPVRLRNREANVTLKLNLASLRNKANHVVLHRALVCCQRSAKWLLLSEASKWPLSTFSCVSNNKKLHNQPTLCVIWRSKFSRLLQMHVRQPRQLNANRSFSTHRSMLRNQFVEIWCKRQMWKVDAGHWKCWSGTAMSNTVRNMGTSSKQVSFALVTVKPLWALNKIWLHHATNNRWLCCAEPPIVILGQLISFNQVMHWISCCLSKSVTNCTSTCVVAWRVRAVNWHSLQSASREMPIWSGWRDAKLNATSLFLSHGSIQGAQVSQSLC